jgi:hypothetical protein
MANDNASHLENHVVLFRILPLGSTKMGRKMGHIHLTAAHTEAELNSNVQTLLDIEGIDTKHYCFESYRIFR